MLVNLSSMNIFSSYHLPLDFYGRFYVQKYFMHKTYQIFLYNALSLFFRKCVPILRLDKYSHTFIFLFEHLNAPGT